MFTERRPQDHSLNLSEPPDDRDLGLGIRVLPDGRVEQESDPEGRQPEPPPSSGA